MKIILIIIFLSISSFCFAQRDSTVYKALTDAIPILEKQRKAVTTVNIEYIELAKQIKDYQEIILFIQQNWYQEELKRK